MRLRRLVPALIAVVSLAAAVAMRDARLDDAFITFRYGQNLARGHGLVFNPGERVLGTTSPGHALLAAAVYAIFGEGATPSAMAFLGALAWGGQALVLFAWLAADARKNGRDETIAAAVALPFALGLAGSYEWIALETNLAFLAVLASFAALDGGHDRRAGALGAIACMMRPDNALALAVGAAFALRRGGRAGLARFAAWPAVVGVVWLVFASLYYGSPVPRTLAAKAGATPVGEYAAHVAFSLPAALVRAYPAAPVAALLWLLALVGGARLAARRDAIAALPAFFVLHVALYALALRPSPAFPWHLYPAHALFAVFVCVGTAEAGRALVDVVRKGRRVAPLVTAAPAAALWCAFGAYGAVDFVRTHRDDYWSGMRDRAYVKTAAFLREHVERDQIIASEEVGTLAYLTDLTFRDFPGLVTPRRISIDRLDEAQAREGVRWVVLPAGMVPPKGPEGATYVSIREGRWSVVVIKLAARS